VPDLRRSEPPVDGHPDGAQLGQTEDDVEELGAVAFDEGDPVPESDARVRERLGRATGPRVEFAERDGAVADDEGRCIGTLSAVHADDVGDAGDHASRGCIRCRFMIASTAAGAMLLIAWAVTAIRGAMLTGRWRAAVMIQPAASSADSPGSPS
jgi:hypothetical protein